MTIVEGKKFTVDISIIHQEVTKTDDGGVIRIPNRPIESSFTSVPTKPIRPVETTDYRHNVRKTHPQ